jgi:histidinol-phosphate aminotransferase
MARMLAVRPGLDEVEPYVSPQLPARYRMNTNECPYPPPPAVVEEVVAALRATGLNRYPDRDAGELMDALADHVGTRRDRLAVANGSNEILLQLFQTYGGPQRKVLVFEPTYSLHTLIPRITGTPVVHEMRGAGYRIDPVSAARAIAGERPDLILACSPNNPTGSTEGGDVLRALAEAAPGLVIVDEAYIEFAGEGASVLPLLDEYPNLVAVRTFSKAWRLAGARIGYLLASPDVVADLARVRLPYHLGALTQAVGVAALRYASETSEVVERVVAERCRIERGLRAAGIEPLPSSANFVLFPVSDAGAVWRALLEQGVLVRNYPGSSELSGHLRVTAGLPEETDAFLSALARALA